MIYFQVIFLFLSSALQSMLFQLLRTVEGFAAEIALVGSMRKAVKNRVFLRKKNYTSRSFSLWDNTHRGLIFFMKSLFRVVSYAFLSREGPNFTK
jgi:hypothetical protein